MAFQKTTKSVSFAFDYRAAKNLLNLFSLDLDLHYTCIDLNRLPYKWCAVLIMDANDVLF